MEYESKFFLNSTTIQGAIIAFLVLVVQVFNIKISSEEITQFITGFFGLISLVMIVVGRLKAEKPLGFGRK